MSVGAAGIAPALLMTSAWADETPETLRSLSTPGCGLYVRLARSVAGSGALEVPRPFSD
jgi:hypothetical protein